jgi:hypothetical protein
MDARDKRSVGALLEWSFKRKSYCVCSGTLLFSTHQAGDITRTLSFYPINPSFHGSSESHSVDLNRYSERIPRGLPRGSASESKFDRIPYGGRFPAARCRESSIFFIAGPGERKEVEKKIRNLTHSGRNEQRRLIFRKGGRL